MIDAISDKWTSMHSAARWALYWPALVTCVLVTFLPAIIFLHVVNSDIWGGWISTSVSGALLGFIAIQFAYRMAPRGKAVAAVVATLPVSFIAAAAIGNYLIGTPGSPGLEAIWGAAWFSSVVLTMHHMVKRKSA